MHWTPGRPPVPNYVTGAPALLGAALHQLTGTRERDVLLDPLGISDVARMFDAPPDGRRRAQDAAARSGEDRPPLCYCTVSGDDRQVVARLRSNSRPCRGSTTPIRCTPTAISGGLADPCSTAPDRLDRRAWLWRSAAHHHPERGYRYGSHGRLTARRTRRPSGSICSTASCCRRSSDTSTR